MSHHILLRGILKLEKFYNFIFRGRITIAFDLKTTFKDKWIRPLFNLPFKYIKRCNNTNSFILGNRTQDFPSHRPAMQDLPPRSQSHVKCANVICAFLCPIISIFYHLWISMYLHMENIKVSSVLTNT